MLRQIVAVLALAPTLVFAQGTKEVIPPNCFSPAAHEYELRYIPEALKLPAGAANIISIKPIENAPSIPDGYGHPSLYCHIIVKWSNGRTDFGYTFHMWHGDYGQIMVGYAPPA